MSCHSTLQILWLATQHIFRVRSPSNKVTVLCYVRVFEVVGTLNIQINGFSHKRSDLSHNTSLCSQCEMFTFISLSDIISFKQREISFCQGWEYYKREEFDSQNMEAASELINSCWHAVLIYNEGKTACCFFVYGIFCLSLLYHHLYDWPIASCCDTVDLWGNAVSDKPVYTKEECHRLIIKWM